MVGALCCFCLNGSLNTSNDYAISRVHNFFIGDNESKTVYLQGGVYLFINGHIFAPQITLLRTMESRELQITHIIQPLSSNEVTISGTPNSIVLTANGMCYGFLFRLFCY